MATNESMNQKINGHLCLYQGGYATADVCLSVSKTKKVMKDNEVKIKQPTMLCNFLSLLPICGVNDLLAEVCTV